MQTFQEMLRPISEVALLSSSTLLRVCKFSQKFFHVKLGYCKKHLLKQLFFFSKKYTNKFIENVGQNVTEATFSETTEDRGQKHI